MHLVILLFALFASLFTLQKETLSSVEPFFLVGARMSFSGLILISYYYLKDKTKLSIKTSHIPTLFMLSLVNIYLTNIFEIWAISCTFSSKVCLIYSLSPFLAALVAFIVIKETLSAKKWLGMLVGFIGLLPILLVRPETELQAGTIGWLSKAEVLAVGAVFCSVYGWILLKKLITDFNYSPVVANGYSMLFGGTLALMHSYLSGEPWHPVPVTNFKPFIINSLIMCIISNIICYNLYGYLLQRFTATFMSFAGLVTPLFATLFGFVFLGEDIPWQTFFSMALFSIGLWIFYQQEIKRGEAYRAVPCKTNNIKQSEAVN